MNKKQLQESPNRLERYLKDLLEPVGCSERRQQGGAYVRAFLLDAKRKRIEPMANRLPDGNVQAMQQFISQSPWDSIVVRRRVAERMAEELIPA
jgi:SRSO17 transposase